MDVNDVIAATNHRAKEVGSVNFQTSNNATALNYASIIIIIKAFK